MKTTKTVFFILLSACFLSACGLGEPQHDTETAKKLLAGEEVPYTDTYHFLRQEHSSSTIAMVLVDLGYDRNSNEWYEAFNRLKLQSSYMVRLKTSEEIEQEKQTNTVSPAKTGAETFYPDN